MVHIARLATVPTVPTGLSGRRFAGGLVGLTVLVLLPMPMAAQTTTRVGAQPTTMVRLIQPGLDIRLGPSWSQRTRLQIRALMVESLGANDGESTQRCLREAVALARRVLEATPDDPESHALLAMALGLEVEKRGGRARLSAGAEVRSEAEAALALDPTQPGAHHVLGRLHAAAMRMNRFTRFAVRTILGGSVLDGASWELAEDHLRQARIHEPDSPRHAMELGALYMDTDRPDLARTMLEEAVSLGNSDVADLPAVERARTLLTELGSEG
jgi:hypothetical protein